MAGFICAGSQTRVSFLSTTYATWDTIKKARGWLERQGIAYAFRDYKKAPPSEVELKGWSGQVGWQALLNKAGTTFRKLPDSDKGDLDEARAIALMAANPSLIKRPVVTGAGDLLVGFKPDLWATALLR